MLSVAEAFRYRFHRYRGERRDCGCRTLLRERKVYRSIDSNSGHFPSDAAQEAFLCQSLIAVVVVDRLVVTLKRRLGKETGAMGTKAMASKWFFDNHTDALGRESPCLVQVPQT